jgi:hypothetical protein
MRLNLLVTGFAVACAFGCYRNRLASLPRLDELAQPSASQASIAQAVCLAIRQQGERPDEFFADVKEGADGNIVFHLWHRNAFPLNTNVVGNPGGKCRDVYFDKSTQRVTKILFWK